MAKTSQRLPGHTPKSVDWSDLQLLVAVRRSGSMLRAARRLGLAASTISRRMQALERATGATLFERSPLGILTRNEADVAVRTVHHRESSLRTRSAVPRLRAVPLNTTRTVGLVLGLCGRLRAGTLTVEESHERAVSSLKDTLNHSVTVDWLYVDALERAIAGRPVNAEAARFFEPPAPFARCAAFAAAQRAVDIWPLGTDA